MDGDKFSIYTTKYNNSNSNNHSHPQAPNENAVKTTKREKRFKTQNKYLGRNELRDYIADVLISAYMNHKIINKSTLEYTHLAADVPITLLS